MLPLRETFALRPLTAAAFLALIATPIAQPHPAYAETSPSHIAEGRGHDRHHHVSTATEPRGAHADEHESHDEKTGHNQGRGKDDHTGHAHETEGHEDSHEKHGQGKGEKPGHDHGAHQGHGHDEHKDHEAAQHDDEQGVKFTQEVMREFGIAVERAGPGVIARTITRPAEVTYNLDRFTHVVPRVAGIVKAVKASQGDTVEAGVVVAEIESRELAELKAAYLASIERFELAKQDYERVRALRRKGITSEKSYLTGRSAFVEARITMRSAGQKLTSIGISRDVLGTLIKKPEANLTRYLMRAPMKGVVVSRHLVTGELVTDEREAFVIADLSSVWIDISIYGSDLPIVRAGQHVTLVTESGQTAEGTISFVSPHVSVTTRTATARVVLEGRSHSFRPGMFITARISVSEHDVAVRIPNTALHVNDSSDVVFTKEKNVFKSRSVKIGRRNGNFSEVVAGLDAGESYVADGSFVIKAHLSKANFGDGHNH